MKYTFVFVTQLELNFTIPWNILTLVENNEIGTRSPFNTLSVVEIKTKQRNKMHRHIRCTWRGRENYFEFVLPSVTVQWVTSLHYYHLISDYPSLIFGGFAFQSSTWFLNYSQCISPRVIIQFPGHFDKLSLSHWKSFKLIVTCRLHLAPQSRTSSSSCTVTC